MLTVSFLYCLFPVSLIFILYFFNFLWIFFGFNLLIFKLENMSLHFKLFIFSIKTFKNYESSSNAPISSTIFDAIYFHYHSFKYVF